MADITAKRGPIDPNDYVTNQGVATQGQIKGLDRDIRYAETQPSTWDRVMGGIKDVMDVGKSALNMVNSYKDLDVKEEAIEKSKLDRQKIELDMEKTKQEMKYKSIKNDLELQNYRRNNQYLSDFTNAIAVQDYTKAVQLTGENLDLSKKNSAMLIYTADNLDALGKTDEANMLRMYATSGMNISQLSKMYGRSGMPSQSAINTERYIKDKQYTNRMEALTSIINSTNNTGKLQEIGIDTSGDIAKQLKEKRCTIELSDTKSAVEGVQGLKNAIDNPQSIQDVLTQSSGEDLQLAKISCEDPKDPSKVLETTITFDPKSSVIVNTLDNKGNLTGKSVQEKTSNALSAVGSYLKTNKEVRTIDNSTLGNNGKTFDSNKIPTKEWQSYYNDGDEKTKNQIIQASVAAAKQQTGAKSPENKIKDFGLGSFLDELEKTYKENKVRAPRESATNDILRALVEYKYKNNLQKFNKNDPQFLNKIRNLVLEELSTHINKTSNLKQEDKDKDKNKSESKSNSITPVFNED